MNELEIRLTDLGIQPMDDDVFVPVPESELKQLENEIGQPLTEDCRWFFARYGESLFENAVTCPTSSDLGSLPFAFFYGANVSENGLLENFVAYKGQFPKGLIPFAEDGLGNLYLHAVSGSNRGRVYYWDHSVGLEDEVEEYSKRDKSVTDAVKYEYLEDIAPSFMAFILGLQPDED